MSTTTKTAKGVTRRETRRPARRAERVIRMGAYGRISFDREQQQLGVDRQLEACHERADQMGVEIVDAYVDNSISALTGKYRPEFERLLADIEAGRITDLIVWHPDRLTRNMDELQRVIDVLNRHDVRVTTIVAGDWDLTSASGRMVARVLGAVAQQESELKGERMSAKHRQIAQSGKTAGGGPRPFGYVDSKCSAIDMHEAELLREATRRVISGEPLNRIANDWNARGETTTQGRPWSATHLYGKLRAPRIAALRELHGETYQGTWEPIISRRDFDRVATILSDPSRKKRSADVPYLLHGVAVSEFGVPMIGKLIGTARKYYARGDGTNGVTCDEDDLDRIVTAAVFARIEQHGGVTLDDPTQDAERVRLVARVEHLEAELAQLAALRRNKRLELDEYFELRAGTTEWLADARQQLDALTPAEAAVAEQLFKPGVAKREWKRLDVYERRAVVRRLIEAVVVHKTRQTGPRARLAREIVDWPDRVVIKWRR